MDRNHTIIEVDSRDVKFNETFADVRDRKGRLVRRGVVLPPDLHTLPEPETPEPDSANSNSQDGIIAPRNLAKATTISNRYQALSEPESSHQDDAQTPQAEPNKGVDPIASKNRPNFKPTRTGSMSLKAHQQAKVTA